MIFSTKLSHCRERVHRLGFHLHIVYARVQVLISSDPILQLALNASINELNMRGHDISPSICQEAHLAGTIVPQLSITRQKNYMIYSPTFRIKEGENGGAIFEVHVHVDMKDQKPIPDSVRVITLDQVSTYNVYDQCIPTEWKDTLSAKYCICRNLRTE